MAEKQPTIQGPPTIYDVARATDVSIASASRVLNGHRNTVLATRDRTSEAAFADALSPWPVSRPGRRATSAAKAAPA
jgi:DNA-binding LacI/PurR family transcriptional regulator